MVRLLPLILLALLAYLLFRQGGRPRSDRIYRPRASPFWRRTAPADTRWVVARAELDGVRDAYSSAAIDASQPLFRCGGCQAWYQESSVRALDLDNRGRCALCGSVDLREVAVA